MRPIDADELLLLYEGVDESLKVSLRVVKQNIKDAPTIKAVPTEAQIREYLFKNNYTMRLIAQPTDGIDLQELEDRFGKYVRFVVEDMMSGEGKRWKNEN